MVELLCREEVYVIIGAAMEVYNTLGAGFLEPVYQEAFEIELAERGIPFASQQKLPVFYKTHCLEKFYIADIVAYEKIIIEIKALDRLSSHEDSQLLNYLKATGIEVGLLINFGNKWKLDWKRMAMTQSENRSPNKQIRVDSR